MKCCVNLNSALLKEATGTKNGAAEKGKIIERSKARMQEAWDRFWVVMMVEKDLEGHGRKEKRARSSGC